MIRGTYIGRLQHLQGKVALLRNATDGHFFAQFDDRQLSLRPDIRISMADLTTLPRHSVEPPTHALGFGWHVFPESDFKVTE